MRESSDGVYVGIDVGSSAAKAVAVDRGDGTVRATGRGPLAVERPTAGGWEIEPSNLWLAACTALRQLPDDLLRSTRAVGLTGQMCGLVPLGVDRKPAARCLPIFDDRSMAESAALERAQGEHLRAHEHNAALPVYTLPKLLWLRAAQREAFDRTDLVLLPKDYVRGCLTATWMTDPSDASGTLAFDQSAGSWDESLLDELALPAGQWPEVVDSTAVAGTVTAEAAKETGLPQGTPVATGAADMAAVPVGLGATTPDDLVVSFGTAAHVISPVDELASVWPVQQYTAAAGAPFFRFGAVYSGGICADWLLGLIGDPEAYGLFAEAPDRPPAEEALFMPYLSGAGAPYEIPGAAGAFMGLRLGHSPADLARAVLLGLVFEAANIRAAHDPEGRRRVHVTGGGMRLGPIVSVLADSLGCEIWPSASPDAAALGAARMAAMAVGEDEVELTVSTSGAVRPDAAGSERLARIRPRYERAARLVRELGTDE